MAQKANTKRKASQEGSANKKQKHSDKISVSSAAADSSSEAQSSSAQKRKVRRERQSHRRHADVVAEAKILWNKLRMKSNTPKDTNELMDKVMALIQGKVAEIALQHDASRVVQAAVQFGSKEQRRELLKELCASETGRLSELAKIQYAHFCCLKFIKYCARDESSVRIIVKAFQGEMPKLAVHGVAARVVESIFLNLPPKVTASLKQELYGPHFSLFVRDLKHESSPTLESNLKLAKTDTQRKAAIDFVKDLINKGLTKSFYGYTFFQQLLAEYVDVADPSDIRNTLVSAVADHSIHLLSTRQGTRVVAACASYGTPKDRKRICKSLKGYTKSSLLHRDAYLALLRLIQVTDDTVSIHKSLLNEILSTPKSDQEEKGDAASGTSTLLELAMSETGSKLFLMLLVEGKASRLKYFDSYERSILEPVAMITEQGKEVSTSKKEDTTRRKELLRYMQEPLMKICINHTEELLFSIPGSRVLKEVYSLTMSKELAESAANTCRRATKLYKENPQEADQKLATLFDDPVAHRTIKNFILHDAKMDDPVFSKALITLPNDAFLDLLQTNRGAFVLTALCKVPAVKEDAMTKLRQPKQIEQLNAFVRQAEAKAGYEALAKELNISLLQQ